MKQGHYYLATKHNTPLPKHTKYAPSNTEGHHYILQIDLGNSLSSIHAQTNGGAILTEQRTKIVLILENNIAREIQLTDILSSCQT